MSAPTPSVRSVAGRGTPREVPAARRPVTLDPAAPLPDRPTAEAYVASVCFKHGPPRLLGTELEWLVRDPDDPARPLDPATLTRALRSHTPVMLDPGASPQPLPGGGTITVEPGGQVEIASAPRAGLAPLIRDVRDDVTALRSCLATEGLALAPRAGDPVRPPRRILDVPRYAAMEAAFDRIGPHGRTMMCSTTAVQVCVDAGEDEQIARRWAALHELGPVLTAAFANSPAVHGRRTGWKSSRMASWLALDPERTSPPTVLGPDPAAEYARRALDTRLLCVRRPGGPSWDAPEAVTFADWIGGALEPAPTRSDLDYHLTTLFPPVRPQGHLEVRYLDQQPGDEWVVPVAVVAALMHDADTVSRARAAVEPAVDRWTAAARHGLADRVLRRAAGDVFEQAHRTLASPAFADLDPSVLDLVDRVIADRVLPGRCPADDVLDDAETRLPSARWADQPGPAPAPASAPAPRPLLGGDSR